MGWIVNITWVLDRPHGHGMRDLLPLRAHVGERVRIGVDAPAARTRDLRP